jgi:hypothetical protein
MRIIDCVAVSSPTTCTAEGRWGVSPYTSSRDVTDEADWQSSDSGVFEVVGPGRIQSRAIGEAELRATLDGVTAAQAIRVFPGEPPLPVFYGHEATGSVRDPSNNAIEGATVEVTRGHNAGRMTVSDRFGRYIFRDPIYGPVTYRATKPAYRDATADGFVGRNPADVRASAAPTLVLTPIE